MRRILLSACFILSLLTSKTASSQVVYPCGTYYISLDGIKYYGRFSNCFGTTGITGDFTLSVWIRITDPSVAGKEMDIFHRQVNGFSPSEGTDGINLYISTDGSIKFRAYVLKNGTCVLDSMVCGPAPDLFKWCHIALTFRASDGTCTAYENGVATGSASFGGDLNKVYPYNDYLAIGKKEVLNRYEIITYKGDMDELAFCAKALSSDEIKTLANGLAPGSPLIATYKITDYDKLDNYPGGVNSGIGNGQVGVYGQLNKCQSSVLILNPVDIVNPDGSISAQNINKIDKNKKLKGLGTDGVSKAILQVNSTSSLEFSIINYDNSKGTLKTLTGEEGSKLVAKSDGSSVSILYIAPDGYGDQYSVKDGRFVEIQAVDQKDPSITYQCKINLVTPPIVMVHGMWSSPTAWTNNNFLQTLRSKGFENIEMADYSDHADMTFDPNSSESLFGRSAVHLAIKTALDKYLQDGILCAQADVVGHSLGGLMTRSFSQWTNINFNSRNFFQGYVHKLITLGSPHLGTPLGPLLYNLGDVSRLYTADSRFKLYTPLEFLFQWIGQPIGTCHRDFNPNIANNPAYQRLVQTDQFKLNKVHAVAGSIVSGEPYFLMDKFCQLIFSKTLSAIFSAAIDNTLPGTDLIVGLKSQLGGLPLGTTGSRFFNTAHSAPPGIHSSTLGGGINNTETSNKDIFDKVAYLFQTASKDAFAPYFPAPSRVARIASSQKNTSTEELKIALEDSGMIKLSSDSRLIHTTTSTTEIQVSFDVLNGAKVFNPLCFIQDLGWFAFPDVPPYQVKIPIANNCSRIGNMNLFIMARDSFGNLLCDTSSIVIAPTGNLIDFRVAPSSVTLDSIGKQTRLHPFAVFVNNGDTTSYEVDATFASSNYKTIVSANGVVEALNNGSDNVKVTYSGYELLVPVTVSNFVFNKIKASIDFNISDKDFNVLPILLNANSTSGEPVDYKLIKGSAQLINGLVYPNKPGAITIEASSTGNSYFLQPDNIRQTFCLNPLAARDIVGDSIVCTTSTKYYFKRDTTVTYDDRGIAYTWSINGGSVVQNVGDTAYINWSVAGMQTLQVQPEVDGCKGKAISINVSVNPVSAPTITPSGPTSLCNNDSLVISSTNATAYQWYKNDTAIVNATAQSITVRSSGKYSVKTTNSSGCTAVSTPVNVDVTNAANPPKIAAQGPTNVCKGDSVVLTSSSSSGNQWYRNDTLVQGATANTYAVKKSGNYSVQVKSGSCSSPLSSSITVLVNAPPSPSISASGPTTFCEGSNVQLKTDTTYNSYQWFKDGVAITGATSRAYAASQQGTYTVSVSSNGCTATSQPITLTVTTNNVKPTITLSGPSSFCADSSVTLVSSASTGNQWYRNDTLINGATANSYKVTTSGIYTVKSTVGTCANVVSSPITLSVIPLPTGSVQSSSLQLCPSKGATLTATGGTSYEWYFNNTLVAGAPGNTFNATRAGTYSATIINNGCRAKAQNQVTLNLPSKPLVTFSFDSYCKNQPVLFLNNSPDTAVTYQWSFGDGFSSTNTGPTHVYSQVGTFKVTLVETLKSCPEIKDSLTKNIAIQEPKAGIKYPVVQASAGSSVQLAARSLGKDYLWKPSTDLNNAHVPNPVLTVKSERLYLIEITSDAGCITVDTLQVMITKGSRIDLPKAFTPNGDGVNDLLRPIVQNIVSLKFFRVYNRWGQLVYETKTIGQGWDGTFNGERQPVETYTWAVEGVDTEGKAIKASGKSLLIR